MQQTYIQLHYIQKIIVKFLDKLTYLRNIEFSIAVAKEIALQHTHELIAQVAL
jgi:hypothetical protein